MATDKPAKLSAEEREFRRLTQIKEHLFTKISTAHTLAKAVEDKTGSKNTFLSRCKDLPSLKEQFEKVCYDCIDVQLRIDPKATTSLQEIDRFEEIYYIVSSYAEQIQSAPSSSDRDAAAAAAASNVTGARGFVTPRLPKINLVSFDGNIENFNTFYETFCSLVHNRKEIAIIDKFHYLLSSTTGPALSIVKSLPLSGDNYNIVWNALLDKYKDDRTLLSRHLDKMFSYQPQQKETAENLNAFLEVFEHSVRAIEAVKLKNLSGFILGHIALRNLDHSTRKLFEQQLNQKEIPTFDDLISFVKNHAKVLEHASMSSTPGGSAEHRERYTYKNDNKRMYNNNKLNFAATTTKPTGSRCSHCDRDGHLIYKCFSFRRLSQLDRSTRARDLNLCRNCLKPNHDINACESKFTCSVCGELHHVLLHPAAAAGRRMGGAASEALAVGGPGGDGAPAPPPPPTPPQHAPGLVSAALSCSTGATDKQYSVLLATALVEVRDASNNFQTCRALIDSGAMSSFITSDCLQRLGLARMKCPYTVSGLNNEAVRTYGLSKLTLRPRNASSGPFLNCDAVILSQITTKMPTIELDSVCVNEFRHLNLADPAFHQNSGIDLLLGGDVFPEIYDGQKISFGDSYPCALRSIFGYVITGRVEVTQSTRSAFHTCITEPSDELLQRFWEIESTPTDKITVCDPLEEVAEKIFVEKHYRTAEGRYVSPLLLNPNSPSKLGESHDVALRRYVQLEKRLSRDNKLRAAYDSFMSDYESLGHMSEYLGTEPSKYIIPHHCIVREKSSTTPLRVVFDGSCATHSGSSLNDLLLTGAKLQLDIRTVVTNFRLHEICLAADITKMYRQVLIDPSECRYQHILWRKSSSEEIKIFELKTNTYGLRSAPFIAMRVLQQLARDEHDHFPLASFALAQAFYVDDFLWSVDTVSEAVTLQEQLSKLLRSGGLELRKWASNSSEVLAAISPELVSDKIKNFDDEKNMSIKVLGLQWLPTSDSFTFTTNLTDPISTKRSVLSKLSSIYDPNGYVQPSIFLAKCILQDLWKTGLGWDAILPEELRTKWEKFISDLPCLSRLLIQRHVLIPNCSSVQIIGFCDASSRGYAAVIYLRSIDFDNNVKVRLLMSKSKVAPIRTISIPRLELMGAVLLCSLIKYVISTFNIKFSEIVALSDSTVTLSWLQTPPFKLKTFVANRVSQATDIVAPSNWSHVRSEDNMADMCSRGVFPSQLVAMPEWFDGPEWLYRPRSEWPVSSFYVTDNLEIPEGRKNIDVFALTSRNSARRDDFFLTLMNKFSSFMKLIRTSAFILRFINNSRAQSSHRSHGALSTDELNIARYTILKSVQKIFFSEELSLMQSQRPVPSLRKLSPFVDSLGVLRVGGRLCNSALPYEAKHPILLPKKCHVTNLIINHFHKLYLHAGPRTLQSILSRTYWIINARCVIRSVLTKCAVCFKHRPSAPPQPVMGMLPAARVTPEPPFSHAGVDLGGPFHVKESLRRNAKTHKAYLCLFVCFSTKAVHLEVLSALTSECFLSTLDRFVSRRGICAHLYSDCGSNFTAAHKQLKDVSAFLRTKAEQTAIMTGCTERQIQWHFNPPTASHMGGLWEAGIKSAKNHALRVIGQTNLTFEELSTLFCRIEAILNSRPLCPMSNDPNDTDVITAGHLLIGRPLVSVPEYDLSEISSNRLSRWEFIKASTQHFWKRWANEYLHTLQQREKWFKTPPNLQVGDLVLIRSDQLPTLSWALGRVHKVHEGEDGSVRVVTLKTKSGYMQRPVNKLSPLPYAN